VSSLFNHSVFLYFSWFTRLIEQVFYHAAIVSFWYMLLICVMKCMDTNVSSVNNNIWNVFIS
jgi:hypothetical protein